MTGDQIIENRTYYQDGDIEVTGEGTLILRNAVLVIEHEYHAQHNITLRDDATMVVEDSSILSEHAFVIRLQDGASLTSSGNANHLPLAQLFVGDNATADLRNVNMLFAYVEGSAILTATDSEINQVGPRLDGHANGTLTLRPGYHGDWRLQRDNQLNEVDLDIVLVDTQINAWHTDVSGAATIEFRDSNVFQVSSNEGATVHVRDSVVGEPVVWFTTDNRIELRNLVPGFVEHWCIEDLGPGGGRSFCLENSTIGVGLHLAIAGGPVDVVGCDLPYLGLSGTGQSLIADSAIGTLSISSHWGSIAFSTSVIENLWTVQSSVTQLSGSVQFEAREPSAEEGPWSSSIVIREYEVRLHAKHTGSEISGVEVALLDSHGEVSLYSTTDEDGVAILNVIFADSNYDAIYNISVPGAQSLLPLSLMTDTPIDIAIE